MILIDLLLIDKGDPRSSGSSRQTFPSPSRRLDPETQPSGVRCHSIHCLLMATIPPYPALPAVTL
jgi:hypothetical protein